jgi:hypothetical protein
MSKTAIDHQPGRRHEMRPAAVALVCAIRPEVLARLIAATSAAQSDLPLVQRKNVLTKSDNRRTIKS